MAVSKGILEFEENTLCIVDTTDIYIYIFIYLFIFSGQNMDVANFWNAPSIDHLGDGMFCAIYRFPTHVVDNNLFSSSLVQT